MAARNIRGSVFTSLVLVACGGQDGTASGGAGGGAAGSGMTSQTTGGSPGATEPTPLVCTTLPRVIAQSGWIGREDLRNRSDEDYCEYSCEPGWADCDTNPANGCEADLADPEACAQCADPVLFELCPTPPAVADLSTLQVAWAAPNPNVYGLAVGPDDAIATSIAASNWMSSTAPNLKGPALQMSNADGTLEWAMGAETSGHEGYLFVSKDYIYLITRVSQILYQVTRDGTVRWQRQLPDLSGGSIVLNDLNVDDAENVYVYGQYEEAFEADSFVAKETAFPTGYLLSLTKDNEARWLIPGASDDDFGGNTQMALSGSLLYTIDDKLRILNTEDGSVEKTAELDLSPWDEDETHLVLDPDGSLITTYEIGSASADRWLDSNFVLTTPHGQVAANNIPNTHLLVRYTSDLVEVWRTHFGDDRTSVNDLAVMPNGEIVVLVSQLDSAAEFLDVEPRLSHLLRFSSTGTFLGAIQGEVNMAIDGIDVQPLSGLLVVALSTEGVPLMFPDADPTKNWGMVGTLPEFPVP